MLKVQNLNVFAHRQILENINFQLAQGEILGIVGESGCGKSTLLKAILGLLSKDFSSSGEILYKERNLLNQTEHEWQSLRGREISMVFQNCENSFSPVRTIQSQMLEVVQAHLGCSKKEALVMAEEIFNKMCFEDKNRILKSYPFELSGGMNQRVGIAIAMILKPKLLLADEPTTALDVNLQKKVLDEMKNLCSSSKTSIIFVSHDRSVINYMADKIIVMDKGKMKYEENFRSLSA